MKLRFFGFLLLLLSGVFVVQAFQAGNPQVPQGGGNSFTVTGTEAPANSEQWDIINSASTVVATASLPSGWTVSLTGTQFSVAAPTNASVATNYRVRSGSGGVTPGPLSVRKAFFRSQLQSNSYNEWGQYVPPQSIASRRRLAGGGANPPIGGGGGGTTGQSAIFDVVSGGTPPAAPSSLIATPISSSRIDLAWTDNANNESGFTIQRQLTAGGTWADIGTVGANVNSYSSFGLSPDTSYRFRVKATNSWGASAWSNEAIASTFPSAPLPPSYLGNDFWAVLPAGGPDQGQSVWLHIAAPDGATGMIAIPSSNTQIPFTVSAGDAVRIQLPMGQPYPQGAGLRLYTSEGIESKSIRITSDNAITVQVQSSIYAASESFALQPTSVLGKSYVVASYPSSGGIMAGMFAIQATQAATTVTVRTTKTVGTLFQAGVPYTFVLQAGEAFQLRDTSGQDLTGSLITSDKPVAVYSGSNGANVPIGIVAANPLTEQLVPVERWGYTYYSAGFATKTADSVYRVLAYKNNTPIAIDGVVVATIQKGEFYEFSSPNGVQISSTKPIQPFEYCTGGSADFVTNSDPSMTAIPAVTSYASTYLFYAANDPSFYTGLFVNLYVPTSALSSMRLNGVAIPLSNFSSIGSSSYSVAKLAVPAGKNLITSTTGAKFGAINYGFGSYDSFSNPLGGDLPENFVTNVTPLPASSLVATTISSSQIKLAWTDNASNEDGFRIERKLTTPGSEWSEIASVAANTTTYQNTGLNKLTTYIYRVKAYADFDSTPSNEAQATTLDAPPAIPTNLAAQVLSQTEIKLTWNDVSDNEQGFKIQRKQGTGAWTDVQTVGSGITTWTDTGLTKKTTYSYRVYAYNAVGNSDYSNVATATTKDSIPNPPMNLSGTSPSWDRITVTWTDNSDNEDGFKLERRQGALPWSQIALLGENVTSFPDGALLGGTSYTYRVRAYNNGGDSPYSNEATITTLIPPPPVAPTNLSAYSYISDSIQLTWSDNSSNESQFIVERRTGNGSFTVVGSTGSNTTFFENAPVSPGTTYVYRIKATNAGGSSPYSNEASVTTSGTTGGIPYLKDIVLDEDTILGSGTTTATVLLSARTTSATVVTLTYSDANLSGPMSVVVPQGSYFANFSVLAQSAGEVKVCSIYAKSGDWMQRVRLTSSPSVSAISPNNFQAKSSQGGVLLNWDQPDDIEYAKSIKGFEVYRSLGSGGFQKISTGFVRGSSFADAGAPAGILNYKVVLVGNSNPVVTQSPTVSVSHTNTTPGISIISAPIVGTGEVIFRVSGTDRSTHMYLDGNLISSLDTESVNMGGHIVVDTRLLVNGPHEVVFATSEEGAELAKCSSKYQFESNNGLSDFKACEVQDHTIKNFSDIDCQTQNAANAQVFIKDESGSIVRNWVGSGPRFKVCWDGNLSSGLSAPDGEYSMEVSTSGSITKKLYVYRVGSLPKFLGLVMLQGGSAPNGTPVAPNYSSACLQVSRQVFHAVRGAANTVNQAHGGLPYVVIAYGESGQFSAGLAKSLRHWLSTSVEYFYYNGHGGGPKKPTDWKHTCTMGNIYFNNNSDQKGKFNINMNSVFSGRSLKMLFLDCCNAAGKNVVSGNQSVGFMTPSPNNQWPTVCHVTPERDEGCYIGFNGQDLLSVSYNGNINYWGQWRLRFWQAFAQNNYVSDCLVQAMQGNNAQPTQWYPHTVDSATNRHKMIFLGDIRGSQ